MREASMHEPDVIGYWARAVNLNLEDVLEDETFSLLLEDDKAKEKFKEGWNRANEELTAEKIDKLHRKLKAL